MMNRPAIQKAPDRERSLGNQSEHQTSVRIGQASQEREHKDIEQILRRRVTQQEEEKDHRVVDAQQKLIEELQSQLRKSNQDLIIARKEIIHLRGEKAQLKSRINMLKGKNMQLERRGPAMNAVNSN